MNRTFQMLSLVGVLFLAVSCNKYDDSDLWSKVNSIDQRVTDIENALSQMNQNISAISTTLNALKNNVYVTNVKEIADGYVITFSDGQVITVNHGKDGADGLTPRIGSNGNWWIGNTDTGVKAEGADGKDGNNGLTPHIGINGNWWIGNTDTGVSASGSSTTPITTDVPFISVEEEGGIYYWVQILNGVKTWLTDNNGNRLPVTGNNGVSPIIRIDSAGYWVVSYDGGITFVRIKNEYNQDVKAGSDCDCTKFFRSVEVTGGYLVLVLIDGTVIRIKVDGEGSNAPETPYPLPTSPNIIFPNPQFVVDYIPSRGYVLHIYMSGLRNPFSGEWLKMYGSNSSYRNTYVDIDGAGQIIDIDNEDNSDKVMPVDVTFLVDNSGSMNEEADLVARDIIDWSQKRAASGLDVQFGCVGYSVSGTINGALDLTTAARLSSYLNYNGRTGTSRTTEFTDTRMRDAAATYTVSAECGGLALRYADANMSFRSNAMRVYINFTDEPNQPGGNHDYSLTWFEDKNNWPSTKGVVHTIYSAGNDNFTEKLYYNENYKRLKDATGGEYFVTNSSLSGFSMESLPFTRKFTING